MDLKGILSSKGFQNVNGVKEEEESDYFCQQFCHLFLLSELDNVNRDLEGKVCFKIPGLGLHSKYVLSQCSKCVPSTVFTNFPLSLQNLCKTMYAHCWLFLTAAIHGCYCLLLKGKQTGIIASFSFVREKVTTCAQTDWQYFSVCRKFTVLFE